MAWDTELVMMTRVLVSDINSPQKYSDAVLKQNLACAMILIANDVTLLNTYSVSVVNGTISPDPVDTGDIAAQALLPLKAACILSIGSYQSAVGRAIKVRDGDSVIDTTSSFKGYRDIIELGPCAAFEKLCWQIQVNESAVAGDAVFGPYRSPYVYPIDTVAYFYDSLANYYNPRLRINNVRI